MRVSLGGILTEEKTTIRTPDGDNLDLIGVSNEIGLHVSKGKRISDLSRYKLIDYGWFAYNPMRINVGSIGYAFEDDHIGIVSPDYVVFSCSDQILPEYLLHLLKSDEGIEAINKNASGAVRKRLYFSDLARIQIELPDIQTQQRRLKIFRRISTLKDQISEQQSKESLLTQLKQSILQEAIQGKLTADWRASHLSSPGGGANGGGGYEPASVLLERIKSEKQKLIKEKKIKKEKPLPPITADEIPFDLPEGWVWCRLGRVLDVLSDYHANGSYEILKKNVELFDEPNFAIMLRTTNFHSKNRTNYKYISRHAYYFLSKSKVFEGDIIMNKIADPGKVFYVHDRGKPMSLAMNLFLIRINNACNKKFLYQYLDCSYEYIYSFTGGATTKTITKDSVKELLFPLAPEIEQEIIVQKVESLMDKCSALEAEITQSEQHAQHLMQAVLKEAFESEDKSYTNQEPSLSIAAEERGEYGKN